MFIKGWNAEGNQSAELTPAPLSACSSRLVIALERGAGIVSDERWNAGMPDSLSEQLNAGRCIMGEETDAAGLISKTANNTARLSPFAPYSLHSL